MGCPFRAVCLCLGFMGFGVLGTPPAQAQTATLRGFVTDASDGQPLPGVNVVLAGTGDARYGTATDNDGFYVLSRLAPGTYTLRATFIGFDPYEETITLAAGEVQTRNFAMSETRTRLDEVVVESERETAGAANVTAGLQTIRPADIEVIPAPDVSADLVNYLTALPGIVSQGDQGGQLFIRGGEPTQNLVLLDGMLIYQPFHVLGFFSAFPSEIVGSADVYAGGYGGRYGGRLSSVIDVSARTGNKQRWATAVSAAPFVSSARLEGPLWPGRVSLLASARQSVIEQGAERLVDRPLPFRFGDFFAKIHANLSEGAQLSVTGLHTDDEGRLGIDPVAGVADEDQVGWTNDAVGARLIFLPANLPIFAEFVTSYSRLENDFGPEARPVRTTSVGRFNFQANVTHYAGNLDVNWGLFLSTLSLSSRLDGQFQNLNLKDESVTEAGLYFEPEYRVGSGLRVQPALRVHAFPSKSRTFLEPRLRVVWNRGLHRFSGAVGLYHQEIAGLADRRDAGDVFTVWTASPLGLVPEAWHFIAGWNVRPAPWLGFSLEGFYKRLSNLVVPEWTAFPRFTTNLQQAGGTALGGDVRLEVGTGPFYGMASYGYSKVTYETRIPALQLLTGEPSVSYDPPHDRRHQVNLTASLTLAGFTLNTRWQFGSGLPFNRSIGFDRFVLLDSLVNVTEVPGTERVLYQRPYTGRLPAYHRLDVSLDRAFRLQPHVFLTVQAGVINLYDRRNLFYFDLFTLRRVDQLPLLPTFGLKLEVH
ncbi:TonB-dependent receptor [Rhodocaloribacter litoris]|uniref:TonB-dependent receptor n=1 Tax=Rhodocaloribacter litoris TaxID=2558931 RepID=UPI00141EC7FF|nr:TonB-dependent receptor [Rhodocaloribacter litoris]QXD16515.1 TonB-dependent receptor [Rhodocaloribacter litoris]